jgi:glycosyltransferase involved in cell wall biosynthesis
MRIGLISGEYPPMQGGIGAYTALLAQHLAAEGAYVSILTSSSAAASERSVHISNVIQHWDGRAWLAARRWQREQQLDVICLQYQTAAYAMSPHIHFLPEVLRPTPLVTTFHDLRVPYLFPKAGNLREWMVMRLARHSTAAITTNHEDMQRLRHLRCQKLIPIGSNIAVKTPKPDTITKLRTKASAQPDDFLIGHFGIINHSKGLNTLLDALVLLRDQRINARLVIIGGTTGDSDHTNAKVADEIQAQIKRLELGASVFSTGYLDDEAVSYWLAAVDVVALPFRDGASYRRGSLLAALAHGCPIITTQPSATIPTFTNGENMLLTPPDDSTALARALRQLRDDAVLRQTLGANAAQTAALFDWGQIARDHLRFFQEILEAHP